MLMEGKKGIILGVANKRSIAWGIAQSLFEQGAEIAFGYQTDRFKQTLEKLTSEYKPSPLFECDVTDPESLNKLVEGVEKEFGKIDFIIHSIAYAQKEDLENEFVQTEKDGFMKSMEISAYSFVELCRRFAPILNEDASLVALTYLGATQTILNYNMMGVSKAALEASVRYLAADFGKRNIRVNAISAGPIQTLAARGIRNFSSLHGIHSKLAFLRRNTTLEDVGGVAVFLCSKLGRGVTSEVLFVDGGYHNVACGNIDAYNL